MDQNRKQPHDQNNPSGAGRGQQPSGQEWDGRDRRSGMADRRQHGGERQSRNTPADVRMMNEGSSR
jgi:hypothetical protein